ncbi:hypothetical protein [Bacillus sp. EB01]|uniref:hypothetical protein n=1 Tax=Bacillus sp. EB01 TaxID=1347086 RepID=UPI0005C71E66|nr:hypothetical protein [Bacillus sp. EB01]
MVGNHNGNGNNNGIGGIPVPINIFNKDPANIDGSNDTKLNADQYKVFVNDSFVGEKALENPGENLSDIDDFIKLQGITDFAACLEGNKYTIEADSKVNDIKDTLEVYFNNR